MQGGLEGQTGQTNVDTPGWVHNRDVDRGPGHPRASFLEVGLPPYSRAPPFLQRPSGGLVPVPEGVCHTRRPSQPAQHPAGTHTLWFSLGPWLSPLVWVLICILTGPWRAPPALFFLASTSPSSIWAEEYGSGATQKNQWLGSQVPVCVPVGRDLFLGGSGWRERGARPACCLSPQGHMRSKRSLGLRSSAASQAPVGQKPSDLGVRTLGPAV